MKLELVEIHRKQFLNPNNVYIKAWVHQTTKKKSNQHKTLHMIQFHLFRLLNIYWENHQNHLTYNCKTFWDIHFNYSLIISFMKKLLYFYSRNPLNIDYFRPHGTYLAKVPDYKTEIP